MIKKRILVLSILMIIVLLLLPNTVNATEVFTKKEIIIEEPVENEIPAKTAQIIFSNETTTAEYDVDIIWSIDTDSGNQELSDTDVIKNDNAYYIEISSESNNAIMEDFVDKYTIADNIETYINDVKRKQYMCDFYIGGLTGCYIYADIPTVGEKIADYKMKFCLETLAETKEFTITPKWAKHYNANYIGPTTKEDVFEFEHQYAFIGSMLEEDNELSELLRKIDSRTEICFNDDEMYSLQYLIFTPIENPVPKIYEQFTAVQSALNNYNIEDLKTAVEAMKENIDAFNNLSETQLNELAILLDAENGEDAYNIILSDWIDANAVLSVYSVYKNYVEASDVETATAFVEMIDGYDQMYDDRTLIKNFMPNIDNDYKSAKELLGSQTNKITFIEQINSYTIGEKNNLIFVLDTYGITGKVYVNDTELTKEQYNWEYMDAYPAISFKDDYLKSLSAGTYKLKIVVEDGRVAETTFTIKEKVENNNNNNNNNSAPDTNTNREKDATPKTGTKNIDVYVALIGLVSSIGLIILSKKTYYKTI